MGPWIFPILLLVVLWFSKLAGTPLENMGSITVIFLMAAGWSYNYDSLNKKIDDLQKLLDFYKHQNEILKGGEDLEGR